MTAWPDRPTHRRWLDDELLALLDFGRGVAHPEGGAAVLGDDGEPQVGEPVQLWISARMVHVYSLGAMLGVPGSRPIAEAVVRGLSGPLVDDEYGGWHSAVDPAGRPLPGGKSCYDHAFALLAGSTATAAGLRGAGLPGPGRLFERAQQVFLERFWDDSVGMCVDSWSRDWSALDDYRGTNANMHAVEAMLATGDVTGDPAWHGRAARIVTRIVDLARSHDWRIPEHFAPDWTPLLEHHRDRPADPFKPYGATVGHGLEWSRLLLQTEATLGGAAPVGLADAAVALFDRAVADGWYVDGAPGFVYTTDWHGTPVVRSRMHWVAAEAVAAGAALWRRTGEDRYADLYATWWDYIDTYLRDHRRGSWFHELDEENRPAAETWAGKPDLYHAVQATLLPRLPAAPSIATAVAAGLLG